MQQFNRAIRKYILIILASCFILIGCQSTLPEPPTMTVAPGIISLVRKAGMTDQAAQIFLNQQPSLVTSKAFYARCRSGPNQESSVILGCFIRRAGEGRIYIQSISDKRLKGTMEVVAAHEMLHAAFSRLSPAERKALAPRLEQAAKYYDNPAILPVLQDYQARSTDVYINELHSYLGTDLKDLGDKDLESYYKRYFKDRERLVGIAQSTQNELYTYQRRAKELESQIASLKAFLGSEKEYLQRAVQDIQQYEKNLSRQRQTIDSQITQQNKQIRQGNYDRLAQLNVAQTDANRSSQVIEQKIRDYQNRSLDYEAKVDEYNLMVDEYTKLTRDREDILNILRK